MEITKKELTLWFEYIKKCKILVVGDVMTDIYINGQVSRISPEAPVPIVNVNEIRYCLGGAANVALNLQAMGAKPLLCGIVGEDVKGYEFMKLMTNHKMDVSAMLSMERRTTTTKTRIIGNKVQLLRMDEENDAPIDSKQTEIMYKNVENILLNAKIDAIIFADYDKGVITYDLISRITHIAQEKSIPISVDPKKRNFLNYQGITLFKPNLSELSNGLTLDKNKLALEDINKQVEAFMQTHKHKMVMITLSDKGMVICYQKQSTFVSEWIPAQVRSIADVSGAGDTVISVATLALIYGFPPRLIAELSNIAGGLVCEKVGVVPIEKHQLSNESLKILGKPML
ncbi:MAG: D-glycero-beta-D-manno-heptose-7-phosphate kinase [Bacteroidales bacterium]|nr:D-glycero-beta-D-manno-heptose-7-phosphate kinase [Bacteroidales bacterium]